MATYPASTTHDRDSSSPPEGRRRWWAMVVVGLGVSLVIVDATIVTVMLPQVITDLRLSTASAEWVTAVYALVFAALLIPLGRLGDAYGRRRMFVAGTVVFVLAGLAAALSGGAASLIAARVVQGVGASMIMPATLSTVNAVYTGRDRAIAFGIWGSLIGGMAALGPLLGGWLATSYGWRWAFAVNVPLGAAVIVGTLLLVPETRDAARRRGVDWAGAALLAVGLAALVFGLIEGQRYGWWAPLGGFASGWPVSPVPIAFVLTGCCLALLIPTQRARLRAGKVVALDLSLFRIPGFRTANVTACLVSVGEFGLLFTLPLFLQNIRDGSPLSTALAILPLAVGSFLAGPFAARLSARHGAHQVVRIGLALETVAAVGVGMTVSAHTTGFGLAPWMFVYGVGLGLASAQLTGVALRDVPHAAAGQASGTQSTARQVGSALGVAVLGTLFAVSLGRVAAQRLHDGPLPPDQRAAVTRALRDTAGTSARTLRDTPGYDEASGAVDAALATSTDRVAYGAAGLLGLGLVASLGLRGRDRRGESGA